MVARRPPQSPKDSRKTSLTPLWQPRRQVQTIRGKRGRVWRTRVPSLRASSHPPTLSFLSGGGGGFLNHGARDSATRTRPRVQREAIHFTPLVAGSQCHRELGHIALVSDFDLKSAASKSIWVFYRRAPRRNIVPRNNEWTASMQVSSLQRRYAEPTLKPSSSVLL